MEKRKLKKLGLWLGTLVCAAAVTGCGQGAREKEQAADNSAEATEEAAQAPESEDVSSDGAKEQETGEEKLTITWLNHYQEAGKQAWVQKCKEVYEEKYPNVTLNIETVGADNYTTILQTKLASDDAPAIFDLASNYDLSVYDEAGHLADLSGQPCLDLVDSDLLLEGQVSGVQKGIPIEITGYGVFYNEDVFEENQLEIPTT